MVISKPVVIGGDFNFPNQKWENKWPKIDVGFTDQQEQFVNLVNRFCLYNYVDKPTRVDNILDLILCNDIDMITGCEVDINSKISDHNLVICKINEDTIERVSECNEEPIEYFTKFPSYAWKKGTPDQWKEYETKLYSNEWDKSPDLNIEDKLKEFLVKIEEAIKDSFEDLLERKKVRKRIPKFIKKLFKKKTKISKRIFRTKYKIKMVKLKDELETIKKKLKRIKKKS